MHSAGGDALGFHTRFCRTWRCPCMEEGKDLRTLFFVVVIVMNKEPNPILLHCQCSHTKTSHAVSSLGMWLWRNGNYFPLSFCKLLALLQEEQRRLVYPAFCSLLFSVSLLFQHRDSLLVSHHGRTIWKIHLATG